MAKKFILSGLIIFALTGCQNSMTSPLDSSLPKTQIAEDKSSNGTSAISNTEAMNKRVLLTKDKYPKQSQDPEACNKNYNFNDDPVDSKTSYSDAEKGIFFDIPYNQDWGNEQFELTPYDQEQDEMSFGPIQDLGACNWIRSYAFKVLPKRTSEEAIRSIKEDFSPKQLPMPPEMMRLNNFTAIQYISSGVCKYPTIELVGKKYNYEFYASTCEADVQKFQKDLEIIKGIVSSVHLE